MGDLLKLAEQLTKKAYDPEEAAAEAEEKEHPKLIDYRTTTYQKEEKPMPKKDVYEMVGEALIAKLKEPMPKDERPATRKQKGWIYYNLKLSTYSLSISMKDMSVLIERSQRSKEEKAKVLFRLRQMGAKECK